MIEKSALEAAYEKMLTIRLAEETISADFIKRKIFSFYHSSAGQEAVAVGVCMNLDDKDRVYGNHRSHAHYLAKGGDLYRMFCEIYGKADGCCHGKGGSMHMLDRSVGFMGATPLLGSIVPIALGSAFEQKYRNSRSQETGERNITVVFFGDGASEEGVVYESINLAAVMNLPILFVIEDNLFAVNTQEQDRRSLFFDRRLVYEGLGVRYLNCNGNSFPDTYSAASKCADSVRNGEGPHVLCARVFRHMAHSGPITDESVRVFDTKVVRDALDCIRGVEKRLETADASELRSYIETVVYSAWQRAQECQEPAPSEASKGVYAG